MVGDQALFPLQQTTGIAICGDIEPCKNHELMNACAALDEQAFYTIERYRPTKL
jgi:uncharacterized protein (UPF0179 family)